MMDVLMVGTLAVSFGLVWLLIRWCQKQLDDYLVYALVHPERF